VCLPADTAAAHVEPQLVADFKAWLRKHAGRPRTIALCSRRRPHVDGPPRTRRLVRRRSQLLHGTREQVRSGTIEKMTTSLRAFLRYLAVEGRCRAVSTTRSGLRPLAACRHAAVPVGRAGQAADRCV
jgi:hypothetical protein